VWITLVSSLSRRDRIKCLQFYVSYAQMKYGVKHCLGSGECQAVEPGCRLASPGTNTLRSMFPNTKEAATLAFHFWSGEFVYLCEPVW